MSKLRMNPDLKKGEEPLVAYVDRRSLDDIFVRGEQGDQRMNKYIITGNLISGLRGVTVKGKIIDYSDADGNHHLVEFLVQRDGTLADKKILFDIGPDRRGIDGMTLDEAGNIYATAGRGEHSGIYVFSPESKHLAFIPTAETPTNCVFGGGSEKSTLYITAQASKGADGKKVWGLYRIKPVSYTHLTLPTNREV